MCDVVCCSWRRCPRYLHVLTHSSPTRRSSDLFGGHGRGFGRDARPGPGHGGDAAGRKPVCRARFGDGRGRRVRLGRLAGDRSDSPFRRADRVDDGADYGDVSVEAHAMIVRSVASVVLLWMLGFLWFVVSLPGEAGPVKTDAGVVATGGAGRIKHGLAVLASGRESGRASWRERVCRYV